MCELATFEGTKRIPFLLEDFMITYNGVIRNSAGMEISIDDFNNKTGLDIRDKRVLTCVTFQGFKWPSLYWNRLSVLETIKGSETFENLVLGLDAPVESLEYPGFFMIPGYGEYVVSRNGDLMKRSTGERITASKGVGGYYTYRMRSDRGETQNRPRHRILCYAFYPYPANVDDLDVNHKDGIPGNDGLDNLEWATRSENMFHAYALGLRKDNQEVEIRDMESERTYVFASYSQAGNYFGITGQKVGQRAKSNGYISFNGFQYRNLPADEPWPEIMDSSGDYQITYPDGRQRCCGYIEAARLAGLTRTSFLRAVREGRTSGRTTIKFKKL